MIFSGFAAVAWVTETAKASSYDFGWCNPMKRLWQRLVQASLLVVKGCAASSDQRTIAASQLSSPSQTFQQPTLSGEANTKLHAILSAGRVEGLRRPDFSDQRGSVTKFYELNGYALGWVRGTGVSPQAASLIANLQHAERKGLLPEDYDGPLWENRLSQLLNHTSEAEVDSVNFDVALTVAAMRYVSDLNVGRVNPRDVSYDYAVESRCDEADLLFRVAQAQKVNSVLQEIDPPFEIYGRTQRALEMYLGLDEHEEEPLAQVSKPIKPGDVYPDSPKLGRLLRTLGDLPDNTSLTDAEVYQATLVNGVKRFQHRHGLEENGWITQQTVSEFNIPLSHRVQQLQLALERLRWIPRQFSQPPIVVNIPAFKLRALDERYGPSLVTNVVVGKAFRHRTPVFAGAIRYVIFRPYWDVPSSITVAELLPHIERNHDYLAEHDYELVARSGEVLNVGEISEDVIRQLRSGQLRIRQRPGINNALGLVKFVFPNEHDVYLHSTPARELFSRPRRDFSHGCIRVEHAEELAAWVLRAKAGWNIERIRAVMNGTETVRVNLDQPIPVLIVYNTAIASAEGDVYFYKDIYGYDAQLRRAIENRYIARE